MGHVLRRYLIPRDLVQFSSVIKMPRNKTAIKEHKDVKGKVQEIQKTTGHDQPQKIERGKKQAKRKHFAVQAERKRKYISKDTNIAKLREGYSCFRSKDANGPLAPEHRQ